MVFFGYNREAASINYDREAVDELFRGGKYCYVQFVGAQAAERSDASGRGDWRGRGDCGGQLDQWGEPVRCDARFSSGRRCFWRVPTASIITNVDDWLEFQKRRRVDTEDYEAIKELCKSCKGIGASLGGRVEVRSGTNSLKDTNLRAWTPEMPELYDVDLIEGRHITDADLKALRRPA